MIAKKLAKVNNSFTVSIFDNGFTLEISGKDNEGEWKNARFICATLEELLDAIKEIAVTPVDD
jgi:hypothetical protein